ncbi:S-layer homology domain-containing protein [Sporosarcina koreensis]|uniref:S-layer homology domain-containing protein n=1 Tax=Sporosarcina koreensis TaxID=334735 RepID=UPI000694F3F3|nr:S-layer homology domain-containing protein [Sporosarcina koreensis]
MKRILTLAAAAVCALTIAVQPAAAASFPDVPKANRFNDEIQYLTGQKIISGYTNGSFQPKKNVSRAEAAIMIGRMLDLNGAKRNTKFKDVNAQNGASGYIAAATEKGIISGYKDGTFRPNQSISRGDMAIIMSRAFGIETGTVQEFKDISDNMKSYHAIRGIAGDFITTGYPDGTFRPQGTVTREQFSAFLARGLSPVYKQRTVNKDGYMPDMTKKYVYATNQGDLTMEYKKTKGQFAELTYTGFFWVGERPATKEVYYIHIEETDKMLVTAYPFSEYYTDLVYPVKTGTTWQNGPADADIAKITGVNKTVKTQYKTFTNAVEVTEKGTKSYYVKGIGLVLSVDSAGKAQRNLKAIK